VRDADCGCRWWIRRTSFDRRNPARASTAPILASQRGPAGRAVQASYLLPWFKIDDVCAFAISSVWRRTGLLDACW